MSVDIPALPDYCWPVDWSAADPSSQTLDPTVKDLAERFAAATLRRLTAYQVGGCPITVRPRRVFTSGKTWISYTPGHVSHFFPNLRGGTWLNGEACDGACPQVVSVPLPPPVGQVVSVTVAGVAVDPEAYEVRDSIYLVRTDGEPWPLCSGSFEVVYLNSSPVDGLGAAVAGILAAEFGKALQGGNCRLPAGTTSVVRAGLSMEIAASSLETGTGIREVDAWVSSINPYHLKTPVIVSSVDHPGGSQVTWRA